MNNNTIKICRYLQHEMDAAERALFETDLKASPALQQELFIQQQVMDAAVDAGIKAAFARAWWQRLLARRLITFIVVVLVLVATFVIYKNMQPVAVSKISTTVLVATRSTSAFINPPSQALDVPVTSYFIEGEEGGTIYHHTGSVIYFPPTAIVDKDGQPVKGRIEIRYREFANPLDFFVSGMPMDYDSAGSKYQFESSGMCEVNALQDGKPLFVNPAASPVIHLSGTNKSSLHNVYFLDTVQRQWSYTGKDVVTAVKDLAATQATTLTVPVKETAMPVKPVPPARASNRPSFSIAIDPGSFEELFAYDGVKMEVMDERNYKPSDAEEHWDNVKLEHADKEDIYTITFTNTRRSVSYKVRPVLEGADYEAALKLFNQKNSLYKQALKTRLATEQQLSDSLTAANKKQQQQWRKENEASKALNALIQQRNRMMRKRMEERARYAAARQLTEERRQLQTEKASVFSMEEIRREQQKYAQDFSKSEEIIRTFSINRFGIWNCDQPLIFREAIPLISGFQYTNGDSLALKQVAVVYKGLNGLARYSSDLLRVIPGRENMLWSISGGVFYYFTYEDFSKANIQLTTLSFTFNMRQTAQPVSSYEELKKLVEKF